MASASPVYGNLHLKSESVRAVSAVVRAEQVVPAYISLAEGPWVSVYPEAIERDAQQVLVDVGCRISARLACAALAFFVREGESFTYYLFENGMLADNYESAHRASNAEPSRPRGGNVQRLLPHCEPGTTRAQLEELLRRQHVNGHGLMQESLARLRADVDAQRRHLLDTHPDLVSRLRALGSPTPALENMLRRFDRLAEQIASGVAGADVLAEGVGRLIGLDPERCLVGYRHIRDGEAPPEMTLHIEKRL